MNDTPTQTIADALLLLSLGERNEIGKDASERLMKLERENTALRADKERLDWLLKDDVMRFGFVYHDRDSIDAGRKAEQP